MQTGRLPWCNIDDDAKLGVVAAYPIWGIGIGVGATYGIELVEEPFPTVQVYR
jgi:hypothetical protein